MTEPAADTVPVRLENLEKRYGRRLVLAGVSLDVPPGITGLVGPNGAGKSTLVRAILGLVRLAAGRVQVFGLDPARAARQVRQLIGVVPEDDASIPGLSGVEMVQYAARLSGLPRIEALRRAHEVLDWCDAGQERYRAVETLSVGMRQKVAFAAAIVHDPAVVILDEPTNGLDPLERRAMLGRLVTLARDHGKTILVSTHVLRDVQSICDRLALLVRGRVRLAGSIADLTGSIDSDLGDYGTRLSPSEAAINVSGNRRHGLRPPESKPAREGFCNGQLRLRGTGPLELLAARLVERGIPARLAADGDGLLLHAEDQPAVIAVWEEVGRAGVEAWALEPERRPLEEVFLAALQAADAADAGGFADASA